MREIRYVGTDGDKYSVLVLREFSLFDFIGVLHHTGGPNAGSSVRDGIDPETIFSCGGMLLRVLWTRQESDERGSYLAVGLTMNISREQIEAHEQKRQLEESRNR